MAPLSTAAALARRFDAACSDGRTLIVGDHVRRLGGLGGVFAGPAATSPERVLDLPIADRGTLGFALGAALGGRRVIVELAASGRVWAGLEVLAEAGEIAAQGEFPVRLSVRVPCGGQAGPILDRSASDALAGLPGVRLLAPSDSASLLGAWDAALHARAPTVVLEPRQLLNQRADQAVAVEGARTLAEGHDVTLVSFGSGTSVALEAAGALAAEDVSAGVIDLLQLSPLDLSALGGAAKATGRAIFVQPDEGGLSDRVLRALADQAFLYLEAPLSMAPARVDAVRDAALDAAFY